MTFSDTSVAHFSGMKGHWDIGFIFTGEREAAPRADAWDELKFVDVTSQRSPTT